jgi:hypothetical protein
MTARSVRRAVIPAQAGIQMDSRVRGNDEDSCLLGNDVANREGDVK